MNHEFQSNSKLISLNKDLSKDVANDLVKDLTVDDENRVKIYLKVKEFSNINEKPYYDINEAKNVFTLHDSIRKAESDKSVKFKLNKVFTNEENSYIYEEVCRDAVNETLNFNINYCFLGTGVARSGKKTSIFGDKDCLDNINSRGLVYRFTHRLFDSPHLESLSYQFFIVYSNKYVDLVPLLLLSKNELNSYKQKNIVALFSELLPMSEVSSNIKYMSNFNQFELINHVNTILDLFYRLEEEDLHLFSRSHFIISFKIKNKENMTTTATFGCLAGSQNIDNDTKLNIYLKNQFVSLSNLISDLRLNYKGPDNSQVFNESRLTRYLKDYIQHNCKFRILGCANPGPGYYQNVLDTLLYLNKCKKTSLEEIINTTKLIKNNDAHKKKNEQIYDLTEQIKVFERNGVKAKQEIVNLKKIIQENELKNKQDLANIKENFGFDGDIQKATIITDDITKETRSAQKIREALSTNDYLNKRMREAEKRNTELVEENKKIMIQAKSMLGDRSLVMMYKKMKEDNQSEEGKLKVINESNNEHIILKTLNDQLSKQVEGFKNEILNLNKKFLSLPAVLKENIKDKETIKNLKDSKKSQFENKFKQDIDTINENLSREINITKRKHDSELKIKKEEIDKLKAELKSMDDKENLDFKQCKEELIKMYEMLKVTGNNFKSTFKIDRMNTTMALGSLTRAKEQFEHYLDKTDSSVIPTNFPTLFKILDEKRLFTKISNTTTINNYFNKNLKEEQKEIYTARDGGKMFNTGSNFHKNVLSTEPDNKDSGPMRIIDTISTIKKDKNISHKILPTTSDNKTKNINDDSLSASEISLEMENIHEPFKLKQVDYNLNEPEIYNSRDLLPVIMEYRKKFEEYEDMIKKIKRDKRNPYNKDKSIGNMNNVSNFHMNNIMNNNANIQSLIDDNEKLKKMLENYRRMAQQHKMTIESQERMLEKYSGNAIAYVKLNESSNKFAISSNNPTNPTYNTQTNVTRTNSSFQSPQRSNLSRPTTGKRPITSFRK